MNMRMWIIFAVAVVGVLAGLVYLSQNESVDVDGIDHTKIQTNTDDNSLTTIGDRVYGNPKADVVLIEYGDFQCPGCAGFHRNFQPLMEEYEDSVAFVFRNFPITSIHPNALAAAATVEAAGQQDKYWDMWHLVFSKQNEWSGLNGNQRDSQFREYAAELKLDLDKFNEDITSTKISQKITFDQSLGKANGVTGTPSIYLNGEMIATEQYDSTDKIRSTLDKAIKEAEKDS